MDLLDCPDCHSVAFLAEELDLGQVGLLLSLIARRNSGIHQIYQLMWIELGCLVEDCLFAGSGTSIWAFERALATLEHSHVLLFKAMCVNRHLHHQVYFVGADNLAAQAV